MPFLGGWTAQTLTQIIVEQPLILNLKNLQIVMFIYFMMFYLKGKEFVTIFLVECITSHTSIYGKLPLKQKLIISYNLYDEFYDVTKADLIKKC